MALANLTDKAAQQIKKKMTGGKIKRRKTIKKGTKRGKCQSISKLHSHHNKRASRNRRTSSIRGRKKRKRATKLNNNNKKKRILDIFD
jgi:hypothetical protein